jgi:hypothetical protein
MESIASVVGSFIVYTTVDGNIHMWRPGSGGDLEQDPQLNLGYSTVAREGVLYNGNDGSKSVVLDSLETSAAQEGPEAKVTVGSKSGKRSGGANIVFLYNPTLPDSPISVVIAEYNYINLLALHAPTGMSLPLLLSVVTLLLCLVMMRSILTHFSASYS